MSRFKIGVGRSDEAPGGRTSWRAIVIAAVVAASLSVVLVPDGVRAAATQPLFNAFITDPVDPTRQARVDESGALKVASSGTSTVSGSVTVANTPLPVAGTVTVGNLPATQPVSGTVTVGNLPATQPVNGTVNVGNLPATQNVNVVDGGLSSPPGEVIQLWGPTTFPPNSAQYSGYHDASRCRTLSVLVSRESGPQLEVPRMYAHATNTDPTFDNGVTDLVGFAPGPYFAVVRGTSMPFVAPFVQVLVINSEDVAVVVHRIVLYCSK